MGDRSTNDYVTDRNGLLDRLGQWDEIDIGEALERSQASKQERLEQELTRIKEQLDGREAVHEELVDELEWKIEWYTDRLASLYKTGRGQKDGKRERLQNRIEDFYKQLRQEYRQQWQDQQELHQERREILRELAELDDDLLAELL